MDWSEVFLCKLSYQYSNASAALVENSYSEMEQPNLVVGIVV